MGKQRTVGLVGLFLASLTLTGCLSTNKCGCSCCGKSCCAPAAPTPLASAPSGLPSTFTPSVSATNGVSAGSSDAPSRASSPLTQKPADANAPMQNNRTTASPTAVGPTNPPSQPSDRSALQPSPRPSEDAARSS